MAITMKQQGREEDRPEMRGRRRLDEIITHTQKLLGDKETKA